jgi:hypothetical protein
MSPQTIKSCWRKVQILPLVWTVDITSQDEWEKGKKVHEIEELNMVIATMNLGEDSLSIEDLINMPREHVFISLIATMKSLPNGILI